MLRVLLLGGCLLVPAVSFGASAPTEIVIDDPELIDGRTAKPDVGDVSTRKGVDFKSVIRLRQDFKDKVVESVAEL